MGVVHDVITDASHEGAPEHSHAPTSGNDKGGLLFLGDGHNGFPWVAMSPQELPVLLQNKVYKDQLKFTKTNFSFIKDMSN